jgi:2-dehydropantoate 2-reductase
MVTLCIGDIKKMKILLFGRGVISTQYAWAFEKAGHTVEFYVRPGRKAEYGSTVTLDILDARKELRGASVREKWPITMIETIETNHDFDLIIISVQHYQFKKVAEFLSDKVGRATLLLFNNFWDEPQEAVSSLPEGQLVWGFPRAGGGFDDKGVLNGTLWRSVTVGTFGTDPTERAFAVMNLFKSAGFVSKVTKDFRSWLLGHFVMNAAMHLETLKYKSDVNSFDLDALQTAKFWENVIANGKELLPLLKARNVNIKASPDLKMVSLPPWLMGLIMKVTIGFFPSVKRIFTGHSNRNELKSYCQDIMTTAVEKDISLPRFTRNKNLFR